MSFQLSIFWQKKKKHHLTIHLEIILPTFAICDCQINILFLFLSGGPVQLRYVVILLIIS